MLRGHVSLSLVGVCLLAVALAVTVRLALAGEPASTRLPTDLAVVLLPRLDGSALAVVDLQSGALVRRIGLRSLVTDIAGDRATGLVVGAQSGGVGAAADNAASLVDPRSGEVRYVTLPWLDPARVACLGGRAFLLHSVVDTAGLAVSVVDLQTAGVVATGHAPDGPGAWAAGAGSLWSLATTSGPVPFTLVRVDPDTLLASTSTLDRMVPLGLAEASGTMLVLGREESTDGPGGSPLVGILDADTGTVRSSRPFSGLAYSPSVATVAGRRLVVGDWAGEEPETRGLQALDAETMRPVGPIAIDGVPCALGSWKGRLLVVDRERGRLLQVDPDSGKTLAVTDLGVRDLVYSRIVVLPRR